jgi:hypothetical protein
MTAIPFAARRIVRGRREKNPIERVAPMTSSMMSSSTTGAGTSPLGKNVQGTERLRRKLKKSKRDGNDIFQFDFQVEFACKLGDQTGLGRITSSIAIQRLRVFTRPRPTADIGPQRERSLVRPGSK